MSRPGAWAVVWRNFVSSIFGKSSASRTYVGEDKFGNRFYEIRGGKTNVMRGYDPPVGQTKWLEKKWDEPSVEWLGWLNGSRRFPPSEQEMSMNQRRQQAQLTQDAQTEKRAPQVGSTGKSAAEIDRPKDYPIYEGAEIVPGLQKTDQKKHGRPD